MNLADKYRRLEVRTNADIPRDAKQAAAFGARYWYLQNRAYVL